MSIDPAPRRTLGGLAPHRAVGPDPTVSRLRRDHRTMAAVVVSPPAPDLDQVITVGESAAEDAPARPLQPTVQTLREDLVDPALPRYLQLVRKECRIRQDQADQLEQQARRLNRARQRRDGTTGERITSNTLIRIAIDLLLQNADTLRGDTEDQLTAAMLTTPTTTTSRTHDIP